MYLFGPLKHQSFPPFHSPVYRSDEEYVGEDEYSDRYTSGAHYQDYLVMQVMLVVCVK